MKIIVQAIPPSNNQFMGNSHNFNAYRKEKERWHWIIKSAIRDRPPKPYEKAVIHITYYFPDNRRRDPDNYSGKMILDPLVREGIIADDSFKHIRLILSAYVDKNRPRTEIEIEKEQTMDGTETYIITNKGDCYTVEAWKNGQKQTAEFKDMQRATEWIEKLKGE